MINVNLAGFQHSWTTWLLEQSEMALRVYRGLAAEIFSYMVHETPQYTGESVSNWALAGANPVYSRYSGMKEVYEHGGGKHFKSPWNKPAGGGTGPNVVAMDMAYANLHQGLPTVRSLDSPIFITNATEWDGAASVENIVTRQPSWLREVNREGTTPIAALAFVRDVYSGGLDALKISRLTRLAV